MKINLEAIRQRLSNATPGPWSDFCESGQWWIQQKGPDGDPTGEVICIADDISADDMIFIANAPADIAALLVDRDAWERRARELESLCADRL